MKVFASLAILATVVSAAPTTGKNRAPSPLDLKLEMLGNSAVKATLTNTGKNSLKVLRTGSILDSTTVEKAKVFDAANDTPLTFDGVRLRVSTEALQDAEFQRIGAGETVEVTFDIAEDHDLSGGGEFGVVVDGAFSYAEELGTTLVGSVPYASDRLAAAVDGAEAAAVHSAFHEKRTRVQGNCAGQQRQVTETALRNCAQLSSRAQQAAASGPVAKFQEYFKSTSAQDRQMVAGVFGKVAAECGSTTSGVSTYHCTDSYGHCQGSVLAYTLPAQSIMVYCPLYFNQLPDVSSQCHAQDKATTNLHEATHLRQMKGTDDYGGYGYQFVRGLTSQQNLNHADTYTLFAQAIGVGC